MVTTCEQNKNLSLGFEMQSFSLPPILESSKELALLPESSQTPTTVMSFVSSDYQNSPLASIPMPTESTFAPSDLAKYTAYINSLKTEKKEVALLRGFRVISLLEQIGAKADIVVYRALLSLCVHFGNLEKAYALLDYMHSCAELTVSGIEYGILLHGYAAKKDIRGALTMKLEMHEKQIQPNPVVYGCLIDCSIKSDCLDVAESLFEEMENAGIRQTVVTCSLQIKLYGRLRKLDKAFAVFSYMKPLGLTPSATTFNSLLDTVARCYEMDKYAPQLLKIMQEYNMKPDHVTFGTLIKGYCMTGNVDKSMEIFGMMKIEPFNYKPDLIVYNSLLDGCARAKNIPLLQQVFGMLTAEGLAPSLVTFSILAKAYGLVNDLTKAIAVLDLMEAAGVSATKVVYTSLIQACSANKDLTRAQIVWWRMISAGKAAEPDCVAYGAYIAAHAKNGCLASAEMIAKEAEKKRKAVFPNKRFLAEM